MKKLLASTALGLCFGLAISCDDEDDGGDDDAAALEACQMIIDACHTKDDGTDEMINGYCHQPAHDAVDGHGEASVCVGRAEECVALCDALPELPTSGQYTEGHEESAGHEETQGHDTEHGSSGG